MDGFHMTSSKTPVGRYVDPELVEYAVPVEAAVRPTSWAYSVPVPETGKHQSVYWFTYADLAHLMQVDEAEVKRLARVYGWRSRRNNTTKTRQFYIMDLLATVWLYMQGYYGHKIDLVLLQEAEDRLIEA